MCVDVRSTVKPALAVAAHYNFARVVCILLHGAKIASVRECFTFSPRSTSNDMLQFYGYALQTLQRTWPKHSNRVQIALARVQV